MFTTDNRIVPFYSSKGDAEVFMLYPYLYNRLGEWVGWATQNKEIYSVLGQYVGYISKDHRILRNRYTDRLRPSLPPLPPPREVLPPATIPLPPMMSELLYSTVDVLLEEPERLHTIDYGEFKKDLD